MPRCGVSIIAAEGSMDYRSVLLDMRCVPPDEVNEADWRRDAYPEGITLRSGYLQGSGENPQEMEHVESTQRRDLGSLMSTKLAAPEGQSASPCKCCW